MHSPSVCHSASRSAAKLSALAAVLGLGTLGAHAADLTIEIHGAKSQQGKIAIALFDKAEAFPDKLDGQKTRVAATKDATVVFRNLKPGQYAISAYHDENDNERLDRGMFGIPKEAYGFSRDAQGDKGPPEFADARFELPADGARIAINLR